MEKISIEVEAVTATFLHVEPQGEARWRAAPFRGLARWWYRAVVGAAFSPEIVRKKEESLSIYRFQNGRDRLQRYRNSETVRH